MGKVHGSLARAGKVKSQTRTYIPRLCGKVQQLIPRSQGKHNTTAAPPPSATRRDHDPRVPDAHRRTRTPQHAPTQTLTHLQ
jgi:ribosomal protein S30